MKDAQKTRPNRRYARMPKALSDGRADAGEIDTWGKEAEAPSPPKADSKIGKFIALLSREEGATLDEMVAATGWQAHTTRAAMTGLRKKGRMITRNKIDGVSRYAIARAAPR